LIAPVPLGAAAFFAGAFGVALDAGALAAAAGFAAAFGAAFGAAVFFGAVAMIVFLAFLMS
jgi:hypothetical protein